MSVLSKLKKDLATKKTAQQQQKKREAIVQLMEYGLEDKK